MHDEGVTGQVVSCILFGVTMVRSIRRLGLLLMGSTVIAAQGPAIKLGLWEMTTVRDNGDGSPLTGKGKICIAAGDQEKMMHPANPNMPGCTLKVTTGALNSTFDMTCTGKLPMHNHGSTTIVDSEHIEQKFEIDLTLEGAASHRILDRESYHFVSAECGGVKPGDRPVIE